MIKVNLFEFEERWDPSITENQIFSVKFAGVPLFDIEVPFGTEDREMEDAIIRSVFDNKVRSETEAWLSNE